MEGLLFHCSFNEDVRADYALGEAVPTFAEKYKIMPDGGLKCEEGVKLAWWAPGNIYAARGTLSFFWRSQFPVGPTEFPIFRVAFADHSSWDCVFLRIDYNGHGFDAFITDINLSRARVSIVCDIAQPDEYMHLALAWDEIYGIKFYINGELVGQEKRPAVYFAGLDQFGPHQRVIGNWNVISDYNFIRGGDFKELVIYDRMLYDENIKELAGCNFPKNIPSINIMTDEHRHAWRQRHGFDQPLPAPLPPAASVRKVEIHEAYDLKRWWWKALDGIRETTWPGVYNRSRLKGRNDYFQLPDWDCYSLSGKELVLHMPDEEFNHIEISGSAFGSLFLEGEGELFCRPKEVERSVHSIVPLKGGKLCFVNDEIEEPIGDFSVFNVKPGLAPVGCCCEEFNLPNIANPNSPSVIELQNFIDGRYLPYERGGGLPFVHIILEYTADNTRGLDGIEIIIPPLNPPSDTISLAIQIKDPLWYYRNMAFFTFQIHRGQEQKIWFDLRDRILPDGKCMYLTIACADFDFNSSMLDGAKIRMIYKPAEQARNEHVIDRFTQMRDNYAHLVEEHPRLPQFNLYNRWLADITDLLKVDPNHVHGRYYYYQKMVLNKKYVDKPEDFVVEYKTDDVPGGIPAWAYKQVEFLRRYKYLVNWYIDNRQIENGEFGGGLSDDGDFTATWVGLIALGSDREKVLESLRRCTEAFYEQGLFTNGLPSIQTDELHTAEEGLISLGQVLTADFACPKYLERCMETARALFWITGINTAGHRHLKSTYYSGSKMATEEPFGRQHPLSCLALSPAWFLVRYNGNKKLKQLMIELADGIMAHWCPEKNHLHSYIRFEDDAEIPLHNNRFGGDRTLLVPAAILTGDDKYMQPLIAGATGENAANSPRGFRDPSVEFAPIDNPDATDKTKIAEQYEELNRLSGIMEYYNTIGHPWIDRVNINTLTLQQDRLGGVAHSRGSHTYPRNRITWLFDACDDEKLAILSPVACENKIKLVVCNLSTDEVTARIMGGEILPGIWQITQGIDESGSDTAESPTHGNVYFERSTTITLTFPPQKITIITMELKEKSAPYWERCDLGISQEDILRYDHGINVRIHSLGATDSPEAEIALKDKNGNILRIEKIRPMEAPHDLYPRTWDVIFNLSSIEDRLEGAYFEIDPYNKLNEITRANNIAKLHNNVIR